MIDDLRELFSFNAPTPENDNVRVSDQEFEAKAKFYFNKNRYYVQDLGAAGPCQADPIGLSGTTPAFRNLFRFVEPDPTYLLGSLILERHISELWARNEEL